MQTINFTPQLDALLNRHTALKSDLFEIELEISECPQPRDSDGCYLDNDYGDLCEEREKILDQIVALEIEIEIETETQTEA